MQTKELPGTINGFRVQLVEYKFLWFTFYSKHKIKVFPGYFIDNNGDRVVLENAIVKNIYRPKRNIWYYIYLYCPDKKVVDIIFHDKVGYYENYQRLRPVLINNKRRVQPFIEHGDRFTFIKAPVQQLKNLTAPSDIKIITKGFIEILSHQNKIIERLREKGKLCK